MSGKRTTLHAYAVVGVADERVGNPHAWIIVKKVCYTKEAAEQTVTRYNAKADGRIYFMQATALEPLT